MARFKTDIAALRRTLEARAESLKADRTPHEPVWRDIFAHFEPQFGRPLDGIQEQASQQSADRRDDLIVNSHTRLVLSRLGAGMQGGITSPSTQWFRLTVEDSALAERPDVKDWLDDVTQTLAAAFSGSNIYTVLHQVYLHLVCGNSAALIVPDEETALHAIHLDEGSYWLAVNRRGNVATLLRAFSFTAAQIRDEFGQEAADEDTPVKNALDAHKDETPFIVWNLVTPNRGEAKADIPKDRPYLSFYWRQGAASDRLLDLRSYGYKPIIAPRWHVLAGPYGFGPGHVGLSDAKELQRIEEDILEATALVVRPPLTAPESMEATPINNFPGGITFRRDGGADPERRPSIAPLYESRPDIGALRAQGAAVEERLNRAFFVDLFAMMLNLNQRPKIMTAREVNELSQEKMSLLGPVLTRMNTDLLDPLIDAGFSILLASGKLPPPPAVLSEKTLSVKYVSILHTEQQSTSRLGAMIRLADFFSIVAPISPQCVDKIDADQALDEAAAVLDVPARIIRDDKSVAALREERARQQQAAAAAEQAKSMPGMARAARDLADTRTGTGSALDTLIDATQQIGTAP